MRKSLNTTQFWKAVHEDTQLYCHYFNNDKECPFDDHCIYLHEESDKCKFNDKCESKMCMFRHENCDDDDNEDIDVEESDGEDESEEDEKKVEEIKPILEKLKKNCRQA